MVVCPRCSNKRLWKLKTGKYRCAACRTSFRSRLFLVGVYIPLSMIKQVISEFVLGHSTNVILERCAVSKYKLLKLLTALRLVMTQDIPEAFTGIIEVDETYLGAKMRNRRLKDKRKIKGCHRGFGTIKQPVFGILCRHGQVWAKVISGTEATDLQPLIEKQVKKGSTICSDTWRGYTGIAAKGYVHRLVKHCEGQYSDHQGNHINGLEGFWGYLKRKLAARGGIRKEKVPFFLGEYVWRYNHRHLPLKQQQILLFKLLIGVHY